MLYPFAFDHLYHLRYALLRCNDSLYFPRQLDIRHVSGYFSRVHTQQDGVVILSLQLSRHMTDCHVQSSLRCSIGSETVLHLSKKPCRAAIRRHKDYGADWDVRLQKLLGGDDGTYCVGVQMESELIERPITLVSTLSFSEVLVAA